jgi:hypothetical protein
MLPYESNVDRPVRDAALIKTQTQHFVLDYFRQVPPGLIFRTTNDLRDRNRDLLVDVHGRPPIAVEFNGLCSI